MNNASAPAFVSVPQELFGGLYTEATPESLPQGASPLCVNSDFIVGQVTARPGKQSVFYFTNSFAEDIAAFAASVPGVFAPNETAWSNPMNATLGIPGTYASVFLNVNAPPFGGIPGLQNVATNTGHSGQSTVTATPQIPGQWGFGVTNPFFDINGDTLNAGWTKIQGSSGTSGMVVARSNLGTGPQTFNVNYQPGDSTPPPHGWSTLMAFFDSIPTSIILQNFQNGQSTVNVNAAVTAGDQLLVALSSNAPPSTGITVVDSAGNVYVQAGTTVTNDGFVALFVASNVKAAAINTLTITANYTTAGVPQIAVVETSPIASIVTGNVSQVLQSLNFGFNVPSTQNILGIEIEVSGNQSDLSANSIISATLVSGGQSLQTLTGQLPSSDGTVVFGTPLSNWGFALTQALVNDPSLTVNIVASATAPAALFDIYAVKLKVFLTPSPAPSFNYLKTFAETAGEILNLALGSDGTMYQEDAINNPGALTPVYTQIQPNSFAQSATVDDREFIAISNLAHGTDIPLTYTPPNFDRLSQVGPGNTLGASTSSGSSAIVSITQPTVKSDVANPGHLSGILWSGGPGSTVVGNVLTVYYVGTNFQANPDPDLVIGAGVQLAGIDPSLFAGQPVNGIYEITGTGQGVPPGAAQSRWYFTVTMPSSQSINQANHIEAHAPTGTYQVTTATMTTAAQIPNLEVGGQFQPSGTGGAPPAGYDGTWTVTATPNAAQLQITSTVLNGGVATYGFNLISGTNPVNGQLITVTGTLNGNGIFNVANQAISSASAGSFSINLAGPNISSAAETGQGIIFGTIFKFDPLMIIGTRSGGTLVTTGTIGVGIRKVCYSFLTRNGFITPPSPITTFDVTSGASAITISGLLPGPSNVIARIIHLTAANGGNFYNIPQPVTVISNGVSVVNSSTWVNDNTTSSVSLSFSDGVLLAADQIDIEGNNLFALKELGSCVALIPYSNRLFAVGEQNKLTNLLNYSFDGGLDPSGIPPGWTADPTSGTGGSLVASPIFGFAYQIQNTTGVTQAAYGMIRQGAFQDEFLAPIIAPSTTYSVRVTASVPSGIPVSGNLVVDLFSPSFGAAKGTFSLAMSSMATSMAIYTGTLLMTTLAPVPGDLLLRVWAQNILNGVLVKIDRVEVFPTEQPDLNQQVTGSYNGNFESFDQITGVIIGTNVNQQPIVSAFVLFDSLFLVKTGSMIATSDNNSTEPDNWRQPRTISASVGGSGPYAVTTGIDEPNSGEEYAIISGRTGAYIFAGGQPIKITEEIQSAWNTINWAAGFTHWVKNDITNRRVLFGVCLKTKVLINNKLVQNPWMPAGVIPDNSAPMTPNAVFELNYKQINTANELGGSPEVHRSYSGKLIASEITRKWSIWSIKSPCAAFITRSDNTAPVFLGNSDNTGKIYQLVDGLLEDDGSAFVQDYITSAFVSTETGQGTQMGTVRMNYDYMTLLIDGFGDVRITVYPNTLDSPFAHSLLPDLTLPASTNGDVEIPVNECGSRLFLRFTSEAIDAGYNLSRIVMAMHQDPWSPVRGVNN